MRLGGMAGENHIPFVRGGGSAFANFLTAAACAKRLAARHGLQMPVLMVVDDNRVRGALQVRPGANVKGRRLRVAGGGGR